MGIYPLNKNMNDTLKLKGLISLTVTDKDGNLKDERLIKNTITSAGLAQIALLAGDASAVPFTYLALGTGTVAAEAADTALGTETSASGLERAAATVSRVTTTVANDTLQLVKTFTAGATAAITEAGIFNDASAGTLLGRQVFSAVNVVSGDTLALTYKVSFA
jgi:hypothetical protein